MHWRERQTAVETLTKLYYDDLESELRAEADVLAELAFDDWEDMLRPIDAQDLPREIGSKLPDKSEKAKLRANRRAVQAAERRLAELCEAMWNSEEFEQKRIRARQAAEERARRELWAEMTD